MKFFEPEIQEYIASDSPPEVLIVDDSSVIRRAIANRLQIGGLRVKQAADGKQALSQIYAAPPDLVLLDIVMPGMDGMEVLKIVRQSLSKLQLPVILVTSRTSTRELVRGLDEGANDYITKPVDFDLLWARLSNQIMQKKAAEYMNAVKNKLETEVRQRTRELHENNKILQQEIHEKRLIEKKLQRQANYDVLTGLPNRNLATDRLEQTLIKAKREKLKPSVVFVDLDNFKYVNDTLGHAAGDDLLKEAAIRLIDCVRESDTVARLGGDEFLLILDDINNQSGNPRELDLKIIGERIIRRFSRSFLLEGQEVNISPSIGFAVYPKDGKDEVALMRHADAAMYRAKNNGKNTFCFYSPEMTAQAKLRMDVETQLHHALERNEFSLVYQPIVEAASGEIVKAEVLLRWNNEMLGMITPDVFIPVAEETGQIVEIGAWVIKTACHQVKHWRNGGWDEMCITVNVSARQFHQDSNLVEAVTTALKTNVLTADALQLELTEGILMRENQYNVAIMQALETLGIKLLVDDFGTGYASLSYLQKYNFDTLKIDYGYIKNILINQQDARLVKAIIAMANSLGLDVVSEGVETREQLDFLIKAHCKYIQGYYFSPPVPAKAFEVLFQKLNSTRATPGSQLLLISSSSHS